MKTIFRLIYDVLSIGVIILVILLSPFRFIYKKLHSSPVQSLWLGTPIITLAFKAKAESLLGVKSKSLVYETYFITQAFDYNLSQWITFPLVGKLCSLLIFGWACIWADRLHLYCDRGLLFSWQPLQINLKELIVYKLLGIQVFFWTYGADVRSQITTQKLGEPNCCTECNLVGQACICNESKRLKYIGKLQQYSTAMFSMGDMIEYTPGSRNDLFFWPVDLDGHNRDKYQPNYPQINHNQPLHIVHAPNHRIFKGTHFLIEAVETLQAEGIAIELSLVERIPNAQALEIYRTADVIFDQCLIGFHGYFALEGMAMGKPVMCFIRKPQEYLLHPEECPIINTHIDTLKADLLKLYNSREQLRDIGIKSRQYIEKYFTLEAFAQRLQTAYKDLGISR
ncbi:MULTISPECIES: glycosyltransferase [unclassified Anabaena]|uniref:glycosyltransferase n=1 Tax=unclassified Anabaena TaxID=2619674 RepID=UPI000829EF03|nr:MULTISPECIES: glycosyltransferase [unclassified Anabaena]